MNLFKLRELKKKSLGSQVAAPTYLKYTNLPKKSEKNTYLSKNY